MNRIFDVRQAARVIGVSTNTMYKYLNEGRIQAARGHARGTFKIPAKSLEKFLGSPLPETSPTDLPADPAPLQPINRRHPNEPVIVHVTPPTLTIKIVRIFLVFALILIIIDILLTPRFSFGNQITRISLVFVLILLSYQFGGFVKK